MRKPISQKVVSKAVHNIGFVSLSDAKYITWYIEEKEINIPVGCFISTNGESYSTNTLNEPITYSQNAVKLYFDKTNGTVKVYEWSDTTYRNEVSSYLYIGYVYNNICIFGAEDMIKIYQSKSSVYFDNIQNHVAFSGTRSARIVYDYSTEQIE